MAFDFRPFELKICSPSYSCSRLCHYQLWSLYGFLISSNRRHGTDRRVASGRADGYIGCNVLCGPVEGCVIIIKQWLSGLTAFASFFDIVSKPVDETFFGVRRIDRVHCTGAWRLNQARFEAGACRQLNRRRYWRMHFLDHWNTVLLKALGNWLAVLTFFHSPYTLRSSAVADISITSTVVSDAKDRSRSLVTAVNFGSCL